MRKLWNMYELRSFPKQQKTALFNVLFNPYKPSALFVGNRQTVENQIRRRKTQRLIRFSTGCLQKFLLKLE